jgi:two-component sensor histidine kinase
LTWWVGDLAGALLIAPVIVLWAKSPSSSLERRELLHAAAVFLTAIVIGLVAFSPLLGRTASTGPLAFLAIVPLMWAALRRGQRDTATTVLILAGFAIWGTLSGGGPFARDTLNDSFLLLLAFLISISVPSLSLSANAATQARHEQYAKLVMLELSHRSKNLLAVVQSMARQVARHTANFDDFHAAFSARLSGLADTHDLLVRREWRGVDIGEVMRTQLAPFRALSKTGLTLDGPELMLSPKIAEQIGLALHELATNATKHGAFSTPQGTVLVRWRMEAAGSEPKHLRIDWQESGGPAVSTPTRTGFGHMVITRLVPRALSGDARLDFLDDGLRWSIKIPASTLAERDETPESVKRAL